MLLMSTEHVKLGLFSSQVSGKWFSSLSSGLGTRSSCSPSKLQCWFLQLQPGITWSWLSERVTDPTRSGGVCCHPSGGIKLEMQSQGVYVQGMAALCLAGMSQGPVPPWLFPAMSLHPLLPPKTRNSSSPAALTIYLHLEQLQNLHCCSF